MGCGVYIGGGSLCFLPTLFCREIQFVGGRFLFFFFFSSGVLAQADSDRWRSGRWKGCVVFLKCSLFKILFV